MNIKECKTCLSPFLDELNHKFACIVRHSGTSLIDIDEQATTYLECKCQLLGFCMTNEQEDYIVETKKMLETKLFDVGLVFLKRDFCFVGYHNANEIQCFHYKYTSEEMERIRLHEIEFSDSMGYNYEDLL